MFKFLYFIFQSFCFIQILTFSTLHTSSMDEEKVTPPDSKYLSPEKINQEQSREEFYVFGMGQGNSQLAVYEEQKFAVLYDCGSSSLQKHPKYEDPSTNAKELTIINNLYIKNKYYPNPKTPNLRSNFGNHYDLNDVIKGLQNLSIGTSGNSASNQAKISQEGMKALKIKLNNFIQQTISNLHINHLFIFLSHPDKDHINYINEETIPEKTLSGDLKVTAFLCGDWSNADDVESRTVSQNVINFLEKRDNTLIVQPLITLEQGFSGSLMDLLTAIQKSQESQCSNYHLFSYHDKTKLAHYFHRLLIRFPHHFEDLTGAENVYIHSLNHKANNDNDHSPIVSFDMPKVGMRFICTGDIGEKNDKESDILFNLFKKKREIYGRSDELLTALILPHHGSKNNISSYLGYLFNPDLLIISSGNGKQYGHPDIRLVTEYYFLKDKSRFLNKYSSGGFPNLMLTFEGKEQAATKGLMFYNPSTPPIICTNILGSIRFDSEGVYSSYAPVIKLEEGEYFIDLLKESTPDGIVVPVEGDFNYIVGDQKGNFFLKVLINKDKTSYYFLNKIQS